MQLSLQLSKLQGTTSYFDGNVGRVGVKSDTVCSRLPAASQQPSSSLPAASQQPPSSLPAAPQQPPIRLIWRGN
jgi:hypothetical protein